MLDGPTILALSIAVISGVLVYLLVQRGLVRQQVSPEWMHAFGAALANGLLAIVAFALLDRFKRRS